MVGAYFCVDYHNAYRERTLESLKLQLNNENLQRRLIESRLNTLKAQLRPHFLFNALHSVSSLMETSVPKAREMLIDLAELLRLALHISERDTHSLEEEFDWLEKYLALEAVRFDGQLLWNLSLSEPIEEFHVPCLIVQPLVENALKHGYRQSDMDKSASFTIHIDAYCDQSMIVIKVCDSGRGLGQTRWVEGYGLRYVRESIQAHCSHQPQISLENQNGGGVCVQVAWPIEKVAGEHA